VTSPLLRTPDEGPRISTQDVLESMGEAGLRVTAIDASEGGAGNISCSLSYPMELTDFPLEERIDLPVTVPALAGRTIYVTGAGRRLRQIAADPLGNVGVLIVDNGGQTAVLHTSPDRRFQRLTSELNSHLAVHNDHVQRRDIDVFALVHAQPIHINYLSHMSDYRDTAAMSAALLRWEPETLISLPEGISVLDFMVPGSSELQAGTVNGLRDHRIVVWSKHGVVARSDHSPTRAVDTIEYAETAARYELLDLQMGRRADGLTREQLQEIKRDLSITTDLV
jgi:rhamnulose-1-phosphate aldolase